MLRRPRRSTLFPYTTRFRVEAQRREGRHPADRGDRRRAGEGPTRGVGPDRHRDAGGGGHHGVALGILDRHLHRGRDRRAGGRRAGLHGEDELRRRWLDGPRGAARASTERDTTQRDAYPEPATREHPALQNGVTHDSSEGRTWWVGQGGPTPAALPPEGTKPKTGHVGLPTH